MNAAIHTTTRADLCIGNSRRHGNTGHVYNEAGLLLGRVFPQNRRLRGTGGQRGRAWTANIILPDGCELGGSLGTRFADRWQAARAIRAFWMEYPAERIGRMVPVRIDRLRRWYPNYSEADLRMAAFHGAAGHAAACFKYDHHDTCGLLARYRGADPRRHEQAA